MARLVDGLSAGQKWIVYEYLFNLGHRINAARAAIEKEFHKEDEKTGRRW